MQYLCHDFFTNVYHYPKLKKTTVLIHHFIGFPSTSALFLYHTGHAVFAMTWLVELSDGLSHITWIAAKVLYMLCVCVCMLTILLSLSLSLIYRFPVVILTAILPLSRVNTHHL